MSRVRNGKRTTRRSTRKKFKIKKKNRTNRKLSCRSRKIEEAYSSLIGGMGLPDLSGLNKNFRMMGGAGTNEDEPVVDEPTEVVNTET